MTEPIDEARLTLIEQRAERASPDPWRAGVHNKDQVFCPYPKAPEGPHGERVLLHLNKHFSPEHDAAFIAHARQDVVDLCAELRERDARCEALSLRVRQFQASLRALVNGCTSLAKRVTDDPSPLTQGEFVGFMQQLLYTIRDALAGPVPEDPADAEIQCPSPAPEPVPRDHDPG